MYEFTYFLPFLKNSTFCNNISNQLEIEIKDENIIFRILYICQEFIICKSYDKIYVLNKHICVYHCYE
jgi:hypothetical protein